MPLVRTGAVLADGTDVDWTPLSPFDHLRAGVLPSGVPVLWAPGGGLTTARLTFRVGVLDEQMAELGTTHLVQHLALSPLGTPVYDAEASVTGPWTEFDVHGAPEQVERHLRAVSSGLHDPPTSHFGRAVELLRLEAQSLSPNPWGHLRVRRYGLSGPGLLREPEVAFLHDHATSGAAVGRAVDWARRYFTADNAVLWVRGAEPRGWDLGLRAGARPLRPAPSHRSLTTPGWFSGPPHVVAFSTEAADGAAAHAAWWWLHHLLRRRLRDREARVHDVHAASAPLEGDRLELFMAVHTAPERAGDLLRGVQEVVDAACRAPVPAEELAMWQRGAAAVWREPGALDDASVREQLTEISWALLRQESDARDPLTAAVQVYEHQEARRAGAAGLEPADVHDELKTVMGSALLQVPQGVPGPRDVAVLPESAHPVVVGRTFRTTAACGGPGRLIMGPVGATLVPSPDRHVTVLWHECVGVWVLADGSRRVFGAGGVSLTFNPSRLVKGHLAVAELESRVPPDRVLSLIGTGQPPSGRTASAADIGSKGLAGIVLAFVVCVLLSVVVSDRIWLVLLVAVLVVAVLQPYLGRLGRAVRTRVGTAR